MSLISKGLAGAAMSAIALSTAVATETPPQPAGRYEMSPVDGGFLRLDKETGQVAMCAQKGEAWMCDAVEDRSRPSSGDAVRRLEEENASLKARIKALEETLEATPPASDTNPSDPPPAGKAQLPTEEEVDQALDYVERIFKKFRDRIKKLDEPAPPGPAPDPQSKPL